jgi:hypothetical protein
MDKKNTFFGIVFIAAGIGFMFWQSHEIEKQRIEQLQQAETLEAPAQVSTTPADASLSLAEEGVAESVEPTATVSDLFKPATNAAGVSVASEAPLVEEKTVRLANDFIEVVFTTHGGAIKTVDFLQTKRGERDDYVFNQDGYQAALSLSYDAGEGNLREFALNYQI